MSFDRCFKVTFLVYGFFIVVMAAMVTAPMFIFWAQASQAATTANVIMADARGMQLVLNNKTVVWFASADELALSAHVINPNVIDHLVVDMLEILDKVKVLNITQLTGTMLDFVGNLDTMLLGFRARGKLEIHIPISDALGMGGG